MEKLLAGSEVPMTREKIQEVMRLVYERGSELGRHLVIGENEEQKIRVEFMKDDLDTSPNPALNN